jgi:hypothetical protein
MDNAQKAVEERLAALETQVARLLAHALDDLKERAEAMALFEAIIVLADCLKLDRKAFIQSFEGRRKYYHDLFLRGVENIDQGFAAMLDRRHPEDVPDVSDDEGFPGGKPPMP